MGGSVVVTEGFVILMSYGMTGQQIDRLIEGHYDSQFTPQTRRQHVKMNDVYLGAMLGLRIKMDCSIPINSIPRCSARAEGWQLEGKKNKKKEETKDQIKKVAPSNI